MSPVLVTYPSSFTLYKLCYSPLESFGGKCIAVLISGRRRPPHGPQHAGHGRCDRRDVRRLGAAPDLGKVIDTLERLCTVIVH